MHYKTLHFQINLGDTSLLGREGVCVSTCIKIYTCTILNYLTYLYNCNLTKTLIQKSFIFLNINDAQLYLSTVFVKKI